MHIKKKDASAVASFASQIQNNKWTLRVCLQIMSARGPKLEVQKQTKLLRIQLMLHSAMT